MYDKQLVVYKIMGELSYWNILNIFSLGCNDKTIMNFTLKEFFSDKLIYQRFRL